MRTEKKFYSQMQKRLDEIERQIAARTKEMSETEAAAEAKKILKKFDEKMSSGKKILSRQKVRLFRERSDQACKLAENCAADIQVESDMDNRMEGVILISAPGFMFSSGSETEGESLRILSELIRSADFVYMNAEEDMLVFRFEYSLCEIYMV